MNGFNPPSPLETAKAMHSLFSAKLQLRGELAAAKNDLRKIRGVCKKYLAECDDRNIAIGKRFLANVILDIIKGDA